MVKQPTFEQSFASHPKAVFWSNKNTLKPDQVFKRSGKKFWFDCKECGHDFESVVSNIYKGVWCKFCANQELCKNDCRYCYNKSFASSKYMIYWDDSNTLNPRNLLKTSHTVCIFKCITCNHKYNKNLDSINNNYLCPYCCDPPRKLCDNDDCHLCFEKSFASSKCIINWSNKNTLHPRQIFKNAGHICIFNCNNCNHEYTKRLYDCDKYNCPYCCNPPQKLCTDNACDICFNKSFASHEKSKYWSNKNPVNPRDVFKGSGNKFIFNCECNHEIIQSLAHVTSGK
jgi:hypothetical protein